MDRTCWNYGLWNVCYCNAQPSATSDNNKNSAKDVDSRWIFWLLQPFLYLHVYVSQLLDGLVHIYYLRYGGYVFNDVYLLAGLCKNSPFYSHFPGEPGLASVRWSKECWKWWWQLELWVVQSSSQIITTNKPTPCKNYSTDFHKIQWKGAIRAMVKPLDFDGNPDHITLGWG